MPNGLTAAEFATQLLEPSLSPQAFAAEPTTRVTSTWRGTDEALGKLGLRNGAKVRQRDLTAVVSGRHVRTGARVLGAGTPFDLIFTAPNSLSFMWTQLTPEQRVDIEDAVVASAALALTRLTTDYPVIDGVHAARSFAAALVLHAVGTLSAANGTIPPMLHVHCCLFGVLDGNGTLAAPHEPTMYDEDILRVTDAMAECELADRLVHLGYPVTNTAGRGDHSFEIEGVPQKLLNADFWQNTGCAVAGS